MKTLLRELRDAAMFEPKDHMRNHLRNIADSLDAAISDFSKAPTADNLTNVNGFWAAGVRALKEITPHNTGGGGQMRELLAA